MRSGISQKFGIQKHLRNRLFTQMMRVRQGCAAAVLRTPGDRSKLGGCFEPAACDRLLGPGLDLFSFRYPHHPHSLASLLPRWTKLQRRVPVNTELTPIASGSRPTAQEATAGREPEIPQAGPAGTLVGVWETTPRLVAPTAAAALTGEGKVARST